VFGYYPLSGLICPANVYLIVSVLRSIQIKHFAIAEKIELDIHAGLNVITGETGAGKSIVIRALGLVLGQRADSSVVKHGHKRAEIQADFDIASNPFVIKLLASLQLDEDGECLLRRVINADSGSKAYINGRQVTAATLRQVGERLLDIHGQHEHQSLLRAEIQQTLVDKYAGLSEDVKTLQACHQELRQSMDELSSLHAEADAAHEKRAFLSYQVRELEQFSPQVDEWDSLHTRHQRIHHQAELAGSLQSAELLLFGGPQSDNSVNTQLSHALLELEKARTIDPALSELSEMLEEARTLINESEISLRQAGESMRLDEAELAEIELRYSGYLDFSRKHRVEPAQLFQCYQALNEQLEASDNPEQSESALQQRIQQLASEYQALANTISVRREQAAAKLSEQISESMQILAMQGGRFNIGLTPVAALPPPSGYSGEFPFVGRDSGNEKISFEVSTNPGTPAQALSKVASGGELSRISLAIQLILSSLASVETLVFDEVDVGVGGKTAAVIGRMLAELGDSRQILCITHLPQVAVFGRHHYHVNKQQSGNKSDKHTDLFISELSEADRVEEIARMVGGENISDESLAHAASLLKEALPKS